MKKINTYGEENDTNLKLVIALSRTQLSLNRELQTFLTRYKLTVAQFGVLEALYHKGDMKICELIDKTLSTSGNMTVVIKNLEKEGLVTRQSNPEDRRAFLIHLTAKGETLIQEVFNLHLKELNRFFKLVTEEEKHQLHLLLKKVNGLET
ncbi:MarR family winged helix-turn-helix transcriptional regulator [Fusibacter ferrireducens]|uniref:MarR family transcriptional regulator n=1 Tax=Fusibacter ferrireducens TaxID=2785058 RepID=A0ABR9ZQF3_9FIRM|nr:MarR family transcriptional regulator [Fusibacter ferrireducens]MBF4692687.1 MarR family transcriptional regulator [Fusibacter ferrireducens]